VGMRRIRNHRPTRKKKIRGYGHKREKMQNKEKKMHARGSRQIEESIEVKPRNLDGLRIC